MAYKNYSTARAHIVDPTGGGDFTTIQAAITAASSGQTIFVRPGTYTENITHKSGVNVTASRGDQDDLNVAVIGKWTISGAGRFAISNIEVQTNSDFALNVVGSSASTVVDLQGVLINAANNTAINFATTNSGAAFYALGCITNSNPTFSLYTMGSSGNMFFYHSQINGLLASASNNSAGNVAFYSCQVGGPFTTSGTGNILFSNCVLDNGDNSLVCLTTAGTGTAKFSNGEMYSGTSSVASIGAGTTFTLVNTSVSSSNTNVLTGTGTLKYSFVTFSGASSGHNVTTETALPNLL